MPLLFFESGKLVKNAAFESASRIPFHFSRAFKSVYGILKTLSKRDNGTTNPIRYNEILKNPRELTSLNIARDAVGFFGRLDTRKSSPPSKRKSNKSAYDPAKRGFCFRITLGEQLSGRKKNCGFPEIKILKQSIRDCIAPQKDLGHSDSKGWQRHSV